MPHRDVSLSEAKATLSALVNRVAYGRQPVVILSHGKPKAALVSMEDLNRIATAPSTSPRHEALKRADKLSHRIARDRKKWTPLAKELSDLRQGSTS